MCAGTSHGQTLQSGRRFLVVFPDTLGNLPMRIPGTGTAPAFDNQAWIIVIASETTAITVERDSLRIDTIATAGRATIIRLEERLHRYATQNVTVARDAYEVTADAPVALYCYYATQYGAEAFTPLPVDMWGTEYTVPGVPSDIVFSDLTFLTGEEGAMQPIYAPGQFVVVAAEDETVVSIEATGNMGDWRAGLKKMTVTLDAGDSYLVQLGAPPAPVARRGEPQLPFGTSDMARTSVTSTKPIGVVAGNTRTQGNNWQSWTVWTGNSLKNAATEWLSPREMNGTTHVYASPWNIGSWPAEDLVRLYGTSKERNDIRSSIPLSNSVAFNQMQQRSLKGVFGHDGAFWVRTDAASQVTVSGAPFVAFDGSIAVDGIRTYGAASVDLVPHERWGDYSQFHLPGYPAFDHMLALVADENAIVELDSLPVEGWKSFFNAPYKYVRIALDTGDHVITSTNGLFSGVASGRTWGYEAYRPMRAKGDEDKDAADLMHLSVYHERIAVAYAYPLLPGFQQVDSVEIATLADCFSTSVDVAVARAGASVRVSVRDTINTRTTLVPVRTAGRIVGWSAHVAPWDSSKDASAVVHVFSPFGTARSIPYRYIAPGVVSDRSEITLYNVIVNQPRAFALQLTNRGSSGDTIRRIRLSSGTQGFTVENDAEQTIDTNETVRIALSFLGSRYATKHYDTLIVEGDCWSLRIPLSAWTRTLVPSPKPALSGVDWKDRWLSTLNECTKSGIERYDSTVALTNHGTRAYVVATITLSGSDAESGFFVLDTSNAARSAVYGTIVYPDSTLVQDVRFLPREEREYRCDVRLVTTDGDTVLAELRGVGIESHVAVEPDPVDFGAVLFRGEGLVAATANAIVRALPTRPLTVTGIAIDGHNAISIDRSRGFTAPDPGDPSTWWHLMPCATRSVPLAFAPSDSGAAIARLIVTGDHASCDDSTTTIVARAYRVLATIEAPTLVGAGGCGPEAGIAVVRNTGPVSLMIAGATIIPSSAPFTLELPALPLILAPGESLEIPVSFTPMSAGVFMAALALDLRDTTGELLIEVPAAELRGISAADSMHLRMTSVGGVLPGERSRLDIIVDTPPASGVDQVRIDVTIARDLFRVIGVTTGALTSEWSLLISEHSDTLLRVELAANGGPLLAEAGSILSLDVEAFMSERMEAAIPFRAVGEDPCVAMATVDGYLRLDSICGMNSRLIQALAATYALDDIRISPDNTASIAFALGMEGRTTIEIIDASGATVDRALDAHLRAGDHDVVLSTADLPTGIYIVRVRSGSWSAHRPIVIRR